MKASTPPKAGGGGTSRIVSVQKPPEKEKPKLKGALRADDSTPLDSDYDEKGGSRSRIVMRSNENLAKQKASKSVMTGVAVAASKSPSKATTPTQKATTPSQKTKSPPPSKDTDAKEGADGKTKSKKGIIIAVAVVVPLVLIAIAAGLFLGLCPKSPLNKKTSSTTATKAPADVAPAAPAPDTSGDTKQDGVPVLRVSKRPVATLPRLRPKAIVLK